MLPTRSQSEEYERRSVSDSGHTHGLGPVPEKKEKRGFWHARDREKEKEREREMQMRERERQERDRDRGREVRREDEGQAELTRMIGMSPSVVGVGILVVSPRCDRKYSRPRMLQAVLGPVCALTGMLPSATLARALAFGGWCAAYLVSDHRYQSFGIILILHMRLHTI